MENKDNSSLSQYLDEVQFVNGKWVRRTDKVTGSETLKSILKRTLYGK